jgi:hypothetical protein
LGEGVWGASIPILFSIWVTEPGLVPAPGLGACASGGVCAYAVPLWGVSPTLCARTRFLVLMLSILNTQILVTLFFPFQLIPMFFLAIGYEVTVLSASPLLSFLTHSC